MAQLGWITATARYLVASNADIMNYPCVRDGARKIASDARAAYEYITTSAERSAPQPTWTQAPPTAFVLGETTGNIGKRIQSLFSATTIVVEIVKIY